MAAVDRASAAGARLDLVARPEKQRGIALQAVPDSAKSVVEKSRAQADRLAAQPFDLGQAEAVDLVGRQRQRCVHLDEAQVAGRAARDVRQADVLIVAGARQHAGDQRLAIALERRAESAGDRGVQPGGEGAAIGVGPAGPGVRRAGGRAQGPLRRRAWPATGPAG